MLRHLSASGVHRGSKVVLGGKMGVGRRNGDRAKWSSVELDLANFLAMKCQNGTTVVSAV